MIWPSIRNIIAALIRNALQGKHQCIRLEGHPEVQGKSIESWEWECSCGESYPYHRSELAAIEGFKDHYKWARV